MNKKLMMILVIMAIILLIGGTGYLMFNKNKENTGNNKSDIKSDNNNAPSDKKVLIVYYSRTNNTKTFAEYIKDKTGGDLFQIETVKAYPTDYNETTDVAKEELNDNARPEIKTRVSVSDYDTIFIGCPIWWGTCPMAVFTYVEGEDFTNKTIIPFTTSGGSGLGSVESDLKKYTKAKNYLPGLTISGSRINESRESVNNWIDTLNLN